MKSRQEHIPSMINMEEYQELKDTGFGLMAYSGVVHSDNSYHTDLTLRRRTDSVVDSYSHFNHLVRYAYGQTDDRVQETILLVAKTVGWGFDEEEDPKTVLGHKTMVTVVNNQVKYTRHMAAYPSMLPAPPEAQPLLEVDSAVRDEFDLWLGELQGETKVDRYIAQAVLKDVIHIAELD